MDCADILEENFRRQVAEQDFPPEYFSWHNDAPLALARELAVAIFVAQCLSRQLDLQARKMQTAGQGYYTIGSAGHEGMAAVAAALRPDDMAFLHYRDAAFQIMRAQQVNHTSIARDMLLSFACARDDPISGGRHKVLGSKALSIPPQTSTIASHLPKAVGVAYAIGLAKRHRPEHAILRDNALVVCSFGDASSNHSTAQGAINAACWTAYQSIPMPLLLVCEDNGIGISVRTPQGWIAANYAHRAELAYFQTNGLDVFDTFTVAAQASHYVRRHRKPAFLHISLVRLMGHAGSDRQEGYLDQSTITQWQANDPLLHSAYRLMKAGYLDSAQIITCYNQQAQLCAEIAAQMPQQERLQTAAQVMAPIVPPKRICAPAAPMTQAQLQAILGYDQATMDKPQPMSRLLNWALNEIMHRHGEVVMMGEDIGRKGGVYGVTQKLQQNFGKDRVIDTLLDEQSILGLAIGMAHNGFVPMPEIQFLAYVHNAEDQIRGEAATLSFFSNGQFTNPMVIRIAGLGYQKGFGGHFHNDNSLSVLRDIPGIILAVPSHGVEAVKMLRECVRLAREEQRVVVFIEPIALYTTKDLHQTKDQGWMGCYPAPEQRTTFGEVGIHSDGSLAIVSYGNGYYLARQAAEILQQQHIATRVIDLRWLAPLPTQSLLAALDGVQEVLIVDECRASGNVAEALITLLHEHTTLPAHRLSAQDSFIATGPAYAATLPSRDEIVHWVKNRPLLTTYSENAVQSKT